MYSNCTCILRGLRNFSVKIGPFFQNGPRNLKFEMEMQFYILLKNSLLVWRLHFTRRLCSWGAFRVWKFQSPNVRKGHIWLFLSRCYQQGLETWHRGVGPGARPDHRTDLNLQPLVEAGYMGGFFIWSKISKSECQNWTIFFKMVPGTSNLVWRCSFMFYERIPSLFGDCTSRVGWAHGEHFNSYKNF